MNLEQAMVLTTIRAYGTSEGAQKRGVGKGSRGGSEEPDAGQTASGKMAEKFGYEYTGPTGDKTGGSKDYYQKTDSNGASHSISIGKGGAWSHYQADDSLGTNSRTVGSGGDSKSLAQHLGG